MKECKVIMLPTDKAELGNIYKCIKKPQLGGFITTDVINTLGVIINKSFVDTYNANPTAFGEYYQPHHLYIVSDEEIKKGDWVVSGWTSIMKYYGGSTNFKTKIIATTDKSLMQIENSNFDSEIQLALIPDWFIKKFCDEGGIYKILVNYKINNIDIISVGLSSPTEIKVELKLVVSQDNYIDVKLIKDNYTKQELLEIIVKLYNDEGFRMMMDYCAKESTLKDHQIKVAESCLFKL